MNSDSPAVLCSDPEICSINKIRTAKQLGRPYQINFTRLFTTSPSSYELLDVIFRHSMAGNLSILLSCYDSKGVVQYQGLIVGSRFSTGFLVPRKPLGGSQTFYVYVMIILRHGIQYKNCNYIT